MDKAHRRELKHDKFVDQVGHSLEYAADHKSQVVKIIGGVVLVAVLALAWYMYSRYAHGQRQAALHQAIRIQQAQVGPNSSDFFVTFPTEEEKQKATIKAFTDVANKYSSSEEGAVARYYLGTTAADAGDVKEAEKQFKLVAESGEDEYASQAKLSLAQIYESTGRDADAEKLLRSLVDDPTTLVSKEQATIALARALGDDKPAEARKLLEPLRASRGPVSRAAIGALGSIK